MRAKLRNAILWTGAAWIFSAGSSLAQGPNRLDIPAQPMAAAAVQLGVQARVSIGADAAANCGRSRAIQGVHTVDAALRIMLGGSRCGFRRIDAQTYMIVASPARPRSPSRPAVAPPLLPPPATSVLLDEIVVTATKRDMDLSSAPYALSAVDGLAFDAASRRDTAALATRLAGLTVTNLGPGRNKLFVRGLADSPLTGQTQAMVGLYLDDTRLTYDAPDPDLRLVDLERVELLRGPQGTLYGAGAMGGVLKLISRAPKLDVYEADVTAGLTFADDTSPGQSVDLVLNAPLVRERLAIRAIVYEEVLEGVVDDPGLGLTNTGKTLRSGARVALLWRINGDWQARLGTVFQNLNIDDSQYGFESLPAYERSLAVREPSNNDFNGVSLTTTGTFGWGRLKLSSAYQAHDLDRRYDATSASARFGAGGRPLAYDEADSIRAVAVEASAAINPIGDFSGFVGVYGSHYTHDRTGDVLEVAPGTRLYTTEKRDETDEGALFGEVAWAPNARLKLILGGRYFYVVTESETRAQQGGVTTDPFEGESRDEGISSKAVLEYALRDGVFLYAQASQGYRVGGFNGGVLLGQTYGEPGGGAQPYRKFRPDRLHSYEAGVRWRGYDDRLLLRAASFVIDWRSIQSDRVSADGLPFTANIGSGGNTGFEFEGVWRDGPWQMDVNLMANNPHLTAADDSYPLVTDSDLPGVPKFLGAASLRRTGSAWGRSGWVSGSVGYVGRSTQQLTPETTTEMGDYLTSEMAANLDMGAWSATLRLDNLFGGAGDTFGYGNPFLVGKETVITPQRPRNLSLSLSRRF